MELGQKSEEGFKNQMDQLSVAMDWRDYELIDSGEGEKLERWGQYLTIRPEPRAIWKKTEQTEWKVADAVYSQVDDVEMWKYKSPPPKPWRISYKNLKFNLKPTDFRHVGIFPEQSVNWEWVREKIEEKRSKRQGEIRVLNLFAYTGGATLAAASSGAHVTHVDSSRPAMMWASENAKLTGIPKAMIRWIQDDALKFVNREIRRGVKYDGIIMDPPRFGRGAKGEVWKLADSLPELVLACSQIMSDNPLFFLINAYTADMSSLAIRYLLEDAVGRLGGTIQSGEIGIRESASKKVLPAGIFSRWSTEDKLPSISPSVEV